MDYKEWLDRVDELRIKNEVFGLTDEEWKEVDELNKIIPIRWY